jgi:5-methylcytosine-specific restriction endonuclease McrA
VKDCIMTTHKAYRQHTAFKDKIRRRDNYTCQLCGEPSMFLDHIVPFKESHDSSEGNLRVLCMPCNLALRRKQYNAALTEDEWTDYIKRELKQ